MTRAKTKSALSRVQEYYGQIDRFMAAVVDEWNPPCKRGCAHCCYMDVGVSLAEAIYATEILSRTARGKKRLTTLGDRAEAVSRRLMKRIITEPDFTIKDWLKEKQPCLLLDHKRRACTIYPMRPVACRTYVVEAGTNCRHLQEHGGTVGQWNNHELMELSTQWMMHLADELGEPWMATPAPLPLAILFACTYWLMGSAGVHELMARIGFRSPTDLVVMFGEYAMRGKETP